MKKEDLLAMGLTEEQANKVLEAYTESLKGFIPKVRFDEVNEAKKDLEQQIKDMDKQLKDLGDKAKGNEELTKQIEDLQEANKKAIKDYEEKLKQQAFDFAVESAILNVKGKDVNPKAIKALLKLDNIKLDGDKLIGFDEQINELKKTDGYLFAAVSGGGGGGANPIGAGGGQKNPWKKETFNLTEQGKLLRENPALAKSMIVEAGKNPTIYGL